ncbi:MAG: hypothetical protein ACREOK_15005 [Gemmatimonadaceae bacterium]
MAHSIPPRLSRDLAAEILDRAARIDADERFDLANLRSAAADAGISQEAFERALAEMVQSSRPVASPVDSSRPNAYEVAFKAIGVGALSGFLAMAVVSLAVGEAPPGDALLGALVVGGGALAGVVTYLIRKLKS